ncbi:hypothetical protein [Flavobacterium ovatum]|uniref:hypothetical protein n=1 Tax=Flavobacterium ovatum TaxID=1928857 RepID=UPI00344B3ED3
MEVFLEDEKEKLRPLPQERFEIKYQSFATIMQNGHVQLRQDKNYYSVPYQYVKKKSETIVYQINGRDLLQIQSVSHSSK